MNALQFFDWGFENKKAKENRLKKESDKIYNEMRTNPCTRCWYYRVGQYWYKYINEPINSAQHSSVHSWKEIGRNDIDEIVPYFDFISILYLINCPIPKIRIPQITLDNLTKEIQFSDVGEDGINDKNTVISIPPKYGGNITVKKEENTRGYVFFNTINLAGKQPSIEVGRFEDPEKLRKKIIIE